MTPAHIDMGCEALEDTIAQSLDQAHYTTRYKLLWRTATEVITQMGDIPGYPENGIDPEPM